MTGKNICIDYESLDEDVSGDLEVQYDASPTNPNAVDWSLELSPNGDGFAFPFHLGYARPRSTLQLRSGASYGAATAITLGASVVETRVTQTRMGLNQPYYISTRREVVIKENLYYKITLGAGFSVGANNLYLSSTIFTGMMGQNIVVRFTDVSSGTVRIGSIQNGAMFVNNAIVTTTSLWTWATGDIIEISGWNLYNLWDIEE